MSENTTAVETKTSKFCDKSFTDEGVATFTFGNGTTISINVRELPEEQQFNLMMHGMLQKGGDSFASAKGDYDFATAALEKVVNQLKNDQWVASRASSGESKPKSTELAAALARVKSIEDVSVVQAAVEAATDDQRKAWRAHPLVAKAIADIRAEKAAARAAKAAETGSPDDIVLG